MIFPCFIKREGNYDIWMVKTTNIRNLWGFELEYRYRPDGILLCGEMI